MEKLLLSPEEAADALALSRRTLYALIAAGTVRSVKIGACRRVPWSALIEYVDGLLDGSDAA